MDALTSFCRRKIPFAFVFDYDKKECIAEPLDRLDQISFCINEQTRPQKKALRCSPCEYGAYKKAFSRVQEQIKKGNTYLLNLTAPTKLREDASLQDLYEKGQAKYKVMLKDRFAAFSPESFVKIENDRIHTYPMKGTIDASIDGAKEKILADSKEMAEHTMIVDLLRNDLGIIGYDVAVEKFRYVEDIGSLLQVSSHISAKVPQWEQNLGTIFDTITPAGSITGTPKHKTISLIQQIEGYNRGFFSGIFGVYDGKTVDSCVLIRYIEQQKNALVFKSGGGITLDSDCAKEYEELNDKIYLPTQKE